jgi:hypothetical protein
MVNPGSSKEAIRSNGILGSATGRPGHAFARSDRLAAVIVDAGDGSFDWKACVGVEAVRETSPNPDVADPRKRNASHRQ